MLVMNFLPASHLLRTKLDKLLIVLAIHLHHAGLVPASVTVVWRRPHSHQHFLFEVIDVPLLYQLVRPGYCLESV